MRKHSAPMFLGMEVLSIDFVSRCSSHWEFLLFPGHLVIICFDAEDVGLHLEICLWWLMELGHTHILKNHAAGTDCLCHCLVI